MDTDSIADIYKKLPVVTRAIGTATFLITLFSTLNIINPSLIIFSWPLVIKNLQVWRLISDYFFFGQFNFGWIFHMYFFMTFSSKLESNVTFTARQREGSFLYFIFIQMLLIDALSVILFYPMGKPIMAPSLLFAIIYYWSKKEPFSPVNLWGFNINAWQFPYALFILDVVMGRSIYENIMGLISGHIYYFLRDVLPVERNISLFEATPDVFKVLTEKLEFSTERSSQASRNANSNFSQSFSNRTGQRPNTSSNISGLSFLSNVTRRNTGSSSQQFPGRGYRLSDYTSNNQQ